jgi:hypothetical protein
VTPHLGERLCPLVDGQLCHNERDRALAHLAHCAGCRQEVAEYRRMKQRLSGLCAPSLPAGLADRLVGLGGADSRLAGAIGAPTGPRGVGRRSASVRLVGPASGRGPAHPALPLAVPAGVAAFAPAPRGRRAAPPGRPELAAAGLARPPASRLGPAGGARQPRDGRPGRGHARVRRTLVGSAALMLLTVTGAAVGDQPTAARGTTIRPSAPTTQIPVVNRGGPAPMVSPISYGARR